MRSLAFAVVVVLSSWGCAGDSSSVMSVWNDGGPGGSLGGQTVVATGGAGGAGGGSGLARGSVAVRGGTRDLATTQCTRTSGTACAVDRTYLDCLEGRCSASLTTCYSSDGISAATGGKCRAYANCMLDCPCDSGKSACENTCLDDHGYSDASCGLCLLDLYRCSDANGCVLPTTCVRSSDGT